VSHEVDYSVVDKNSRGRERHVCERIGNLVGSWAIEAIARLLFDNWTAGHLGGQLMKASALRKRAHVE
jgi:hypothetical protein